MLQIWIRDSRSAPLNWHNICRKFAAPWTNLVPQSQSSGIRMRPSCFTGKFTNAWRRSTRTKLVSLVTGDSSGSIPLSALSSLCSKNSFSFGDPMHCSRANGRCINAWNCYVAFLRTRSHLAPVETSQTNLWFRSTMEFSRKLGGNLHQCQHFRHLDPWPVWHFHSSTSGNRLYFGKRALGYRLLAGGKVTRRNLLFHGKNTKKHCT